MPGNTDFKSTNFNKEIVNIWIFSLANYIVFKLDTLFKVWDKYLLQNNLIRTNTSRSAFLTDDDLPASNPPWGYISKIDLVSGKLIWKKPVGKKKIKGNIKNVGTEIFGGVALNQSGILFVTGTDDNYVYGLDSNSGEILWDFEMDLVLAHRLPG